MKIRKAVIPAAGLGTRVLPATKAMPKEMIPIVDKPAIQYNVEEAVRSGIEEICIVLSRGKTVVEDHFDRAPELEMRLKDGGEAKAKLLEDVMYAAKCAKITYVRQQEMLGLGHAVMQAKNFVGNEPFAVLYGDDVIIGEDPCCRQICKAYEDYGMGAVAIKEVTDEFIVKYSSMKIDPLKDNMFKITDMIEKPTLETKFSNYSILGRCALPAEIFDLLEKLPKGAGGEYQLTDAMRQLATNGGMVGVDFTGKRYDMGNKLGILMANIDVGLTHPETAVGLKEYLAEIAKKL